MQGVMDKVIGKPKVPTRKSPLTDRELRFVEEYILCLDWGKAARKAGYKRDNDSKYSQLGRWLMSKPNIQEEIQRRQEEIHSATILSANELLELYSKIARGEVQDQFGLDPSLKDRIAAMKELAKYQIEMPMKLAEKQAQDKELTIKLLRE